MPDYSLAAMLEPVSPGGLLGLLFFSIGIVFIHGSLGKVPDGIDPTVAGKTRIMSPVLFVVGVVLIAVACGLVFLV